MKTYKIIRNPRYDFIGESYATSYPNLHKYPATMIPQVGIEIFKELNINKGKLLDPYCGSGSTFTIGLNQGIKEMYGFDINPLAVLISRAKFTKINISSIKQSAKQLRDKVYEFSKKEDNSIGIPSFKNINFWFSNPVIKNLAVIKYFIDKITRKDIRTIFQVPFSETVRECSYTRSNEFKLYRIKPSDILTFNPDVLGVFFNKLNKVIDIYSKYYYPLLKNIHIDIEYNHFPYKKNFYDVVLTSPPYGDSRTTVAYGQFSTLSNEWLGFKNARQIDNLLMGGKTATELYESGIMRDPIKQVAKVSLERAKQVSSFYTDLEKSIVTVANSMSKGAYAIYVVGNRMVKDVQLPTDQFISEKFENNGFKHEFTYERLISNKVMPRVNSPTNKRGATRGTMTKEYIVVCKKTRLSN